jgi:hypothetical protein
MAHLARQQLVGFLSLLALSNIKENTKQNSIGDIGIVALPSG